MAHGPRYAVKFRRRREGKTDYRRRLALLKGSKTRLVVRRTNTRTIVQFVDYDTRGDIVRAQAVSSELKKFGWESPHPNTPSTYLVGLLAGRRAAKAGVSKAVLDVGLAQPVKGGGLFAALKGAIDGGVDVPHGQDIFPAEDRLKGAHLKGGPVETFEKARQQIMDVQDL
ncbi:MAG TPA: 50S ribosomal protein L18 [Candidatus Thermoplasmatota archaeon]